MKRIDRAKKVREIIIDTAKIQGEWWAVEGYYSIKIETDQWWALIWSRSNDFTNKAQANTFEKTLNQALEVSPPHVIDLYVGDNPKVLSMEWNGADLRLIGMKRGDWEAEVFGLARPLRTANLRL